MTSAFTWGWGREGKFTETDVCAKEQYYIYGNNATINEGEWMGKVEKQMSFMDGPEV